MSANAGDLDVEKPGANADATTAFTYNADSTVNTAVKVYDNGTTITTWTKTYTYTAGLLTSISKWIRS